MSVGCGAATGTSGSWAHITEQTTCEAMPDASCSGAFGFAVTHGGSFTAGPSPTGKTVQGTLTSQEIAQLVSLGDAYLASATQSLQCESPPPPEVPGVSDRIQLFADSGMEFDVWRVGAGVCHMGDAGRAAALRDFFHQLLAKYYPTPFPAS